MAWMNLSEEVDFNDLAYDEFVPGTVLGFDFEGSKTYFKVKRIDKEKRKIWVTETTLYKPEQVSIVDKE